MRQLGMVAVIAAALALASSAGAQELKIGTFDFDRVSKDTQEGQRLQKQLKDFQEKKQAGLATKEKELKDLQDQLQTQALSLSPERRTAMEKDLQRKQNDLQVAREGAQREWQIEFNEARDRIQQAVVSTVEQIGREEKYTVIFETGQIAFRNDASDITFEVIQRLNSLSSATPPAGGVTAPPPRTTPAPPSAGTPSPGAAAPAQPPPAQPPAPAAVPLPNR